jgi:hypothetical protein
MTIAELLLPEEVNQAASSRTQLLEWFDANGAASADEGS